jgi:two-component system, chemotaxis family, protein-glutamate methylesterase/glutaminase
MPDEGDAAPRRRDGDGRRVIVVGASAGGVEALQQVAAGLPAGLPAPVFVVLHIHARSRSYLPEILSAAGPLPACHALDGAPIENGNIYIAPPDHHLIVERDHIHVGVGPKENYQRPSVKVTFRSAALAYGERAI